jgi:basic membrane lipoprotein Med (substrate-binding protein (PBP1-ABC) superfamily)
MPANGVATIEEERSMASRRVPVRAALIGSVAALALAAPVAVAQSPAAEPIPVFGAFATQIEEPWDGVIHAALLAEEAAGNISYNFADDIGYTGDMEPTLRLAVEEQQPAIVFGDAFVNEAAARLVASEYPDTAFAFGSEFGPVDPNFSVFDNWIHEPAYLAGMLAGGLTKSNVIGVVAAMPIAEVNRLANAFILGAQAVNPEVEARVSFINSFYDPATAKEAAVAQIGSGADVLYAERAGVIEAASEAGVLSVGNMSDQQSIAPESVITSVTWNMTPTVQYVIDQVRNGTYTAQDLKDFSMMAKGGASLAAINPNVAGGIPQELIDAVMAKEAEIKSGMFRVPIDESAPAGSVTVTPSAAP